MKLIEDKIADLKESNNRLTQLIDAYQESNSNNKDIITCLMISEADRIDNLREEIVGLLHKYMFLFIIDPKDTVKAFIDTMASINNNINRCLQLL